jgi:hypothetical protein
MGDLKIRSILLLAKWVYGGLATRAFRGYHDRAAHCPPFVSQQLQQTREICEWFSVRPVFLLAI